MEANLSHSKSDHNKQTKYFLTLISHHTEMMKSYPLPSDSMICHQEMKRFRQKCSSLFLYLSFSLNSNAKVFPITEHRWFHVRDNFLTEYWNISWEAMSVFLRGPDGGRSQSRVPSAAPEPESQTQNRPLATGYTKLFCIGIHISIFKEYVCFNRKDIHVQSSKIIKINLRQ